jgi:transposase-like protein
MPVLTGPCRAEGEVKQEAVEDIVQRALQEGPFAMRQLAAECGLSYDVLRSWRSGRRRPNRASVQRLAQGLSRRADALKEISRELKRVADRT